MGGTPSLKGRLVIMHRTDYDEIVAIIHEADEVERMCLTNHDRTQKALKLLKKVEFLEPKPPKVSSGEDA